MCGIEMNLGVAVKKKVTILRHSPCPYEHNAQISQGSGFPLEQTRPYGFSYFIWIAFEGVREEVEGKHRN